MTEELKEEHVDAPPKNEDSPEEIINHYSLWAMGAGAIPVPLLDIAAITGVQIQMIAKLSKHYDVHFEKNMVKSYVSSLAGILITKNFAGTIGASIIKTIPFAGQLIGSLAMPVFSGAMTFAIGRVFNQHFISGGTFLDLNLDSQKEYLKEQFEKGSVYVKENFEKGASYVKGLRNEKKDETA